MLQSVYDIVSKLEVELLAYALIGVIAVVLIVGIVLSMMTGDAVKFAKVAKMFLKNPEPRNATATASQMPIKVKKAFKRAGKTGEKPSDVISIDTCVNAPYAMSIGSRLTKAVLYVTLVLTVLSGYLAAASKPADATDVEAALQVANGMMIMPVVVGVVGLLLVCVAGIYSTLHYKGLAKTYNDYVDKLDALSKGGNFDGDIPMPVNNDVPYSAPVVNADDNDDDNSNSSYDSDRFKTFETPTRLDIAIEEDDNNNEQIVTERVSVTEETIIEPVEAPRNSALNEIDEEIRQEREAEERRREEARQESIERAKAMAEEKRKAAEAAAAAPAFEPSVAAETSTASDASAEGTPEADAIIARIEVLARDGGTAAEMKEAALILQRERAKPQNKTPIMQKRLSESLSLILKAMSGAKK